MKYGNRSWGLLLTTLLLFLWISVPTPNTGFVHAVALQDDPSSWFINMQRYAGSAHGALACETCHEDKALAEPPHPDPKNPLFLKGEARLLYDYSRCASCHRPAHERYLQGKHAEAMREKAEELDRAGKKAPTCGDCHSSHYAQAHLSRVASGRAMIGVCGSCHPAQTATYLNNFHGKAAVNLGNPKAAFCTDCHGTHECLSLKEKEAALQACRRCHPHAQENFAGVVIHPTLADVTDQDKDKKTRVAILRVATTLMSLLVILVVGFFYGHSLIWLLRELHEKLRKRPW